MTFYIPEFWCGVIATILIEFIILTIFGILRRDKKNGS